MDEDDKVTDGEPGRERGGQHGTGRQPPGEILVPVRRRPDMVRFLVAGGFLGFVVGAFVGRYGPDAPNSSALQELILLGATGLLVGLLLGSAAYLLADRRSSRR
ncbi:hypothetical protein DV701_09135 [Ornithinimicrobium avium]|uniref:Uncharacterized protein n=1 Tax=Ornithinimicrobium avium TaxID=2283195 RepID=A0A345NMK9_9MICO|nr:hypothetical protein DV701_09135 [Ornithinimicrobium avium]